MTQTECSLEERVLNAVRSYRWEDSLTDHLERCPSCREVAQTARWMQVLAANDESERSLPDPELVWLKAQITRKQASKERALRSWILVTGSIQVLATAIATGWLYWNRDAMRSLLGDLTLRLSDTAETMISYLASLDIQLLFGDLPLRPSAAFESAMASPASLVLGSLAVALFTVLVSWSVTPGLGKTR